MRQQSYTKRVIQRKLRRSSKRLRYSLCGISAGLLPIYFARQRCHLRVDHMKLMHRNVAISSMTFNLNTYSDLRCLQEFRFRLKEISQISDSIGCHAGNTRRSAFKCGAVTATCILLRRLAYPCRWVDLELTFGMHSSALSEIFWEAIESLYTKRSHLLATFRTDLLQERAVQYAAVIEARGTL